MDTTRTTAYELVLLIERNRKVIEEKLAELERAVYAVYQASNPEIVAAVQDIEERLREGRYEPEGAMSAGELRAAVEQELHPREQELHPR